MNAQELIQASKYDDLMIAPKIAIAGGGTLMDWANINFYKESNEKLKKIEEDLELKTNRWFELSEN